jgi:hypothetical protein
MPSDPGGLFNRQAIELTDEDQEMIATLLGWTVNEHGNVIDFGPQFGEDDDA